MYVNEEDVPLIAKNEVIAKKSNNIWKFFLASVALSALGLAVVSVNYGLPSKSTNEIALSEAKMRMSEVGTLKYAGLSAGEKSSLFTSFKSNFARKYSSVVEEAERFQHFQNFLSDIDERNEMERASGGTAVHGVTSFSDLSSGEFRSQYLGFLPSDNTKNDSEKLTLEPYTGSSRIVDWTDTLTTSVKDQGYCGSCWAFSTAEQIESDAIRAGILTTDDTLSTQQIVSCDSKSNGVEAFYANYGCQGGFTESAYGYIMKAGGLAKEVDYPYTSYYSAAGVCNAIKSNYAVTVKNFYVLKGESSMESHVLSTGPLSVCLDASLWSSYSSGVISSCGKTIDHCVQVVGINLKEGYWIVRNSWGTKWGNKGFIYLSTGANTCGITYSPTYTAVVAV